MVDFWMALGQLERHGLLRLHCQGCLCAPVRTKGMLPSGLLSEQQLDMLVLAGGGVERWAPVRPGVYTLYPVDVHCQQSGWAWCNLGCTDQLLHCSPPGGLAVKCAELRVVQWQQCVKPSF